MIEIQSAKAGDLIAVSGMEDINVGETVCPTTHPEALFHYVLMSQHYK